MVDGGFTEQIARYRTMREQIEREALPLATSVEGRTFEFQASLHDLALRRGGYVVLENERGRWLGQITELSSRSERVDVPGGGNTTSSVVVRLAGGEGLLLDGGVPFHDAGVRPARPEEVDRWFAGSHPDRAMLTVGDLLLAPGVPAALDSGGLNRHTFMCGQSGSGKTYSQGLPSPSATKLAGSFGSSWDFLGRPPGWSSGARA